MKTENQAVAAAKSRARSLSKFMKKQGVALPYAKYLEAVANQEGYKSWEALEGTLSKQMVVAAPVALLTPSIQAMAHSDDYVHVIDFDAAAWFAQSTDRQIIALYGCDWSDDEPADVVALHFEACNQGIEAMLDYCRATQNLRNSVGFECSVDEAEAMAWLQVHRPELWAILICRDNDVSLRQADEPEIKGMWDWLSAEGCAGARSFDTEGLAALDAVQTLALNEAL